jgi:hypothetical protein
MACLKSEFLKLVIFKNTAYWNITPKRLVYRHQSTLKETAGSSEKLKPIYQNTSEGSNIQLHMLNGNLPPPPLFFPVSTFI